MAAKATCRTHRRVLEYPFASKEAAARWLLRHFNDTQIRTGRACPGEHWHGETDN